MIDNKKAHRIPSVSQRNRILPELYYDAPKIDDREFQDFISFLVKYSEYLAFYGQNDKYFSEYEDEKTKKKTKTVLDWSDFFSGNLAAQMAYIHHTAEGNYSEEFKTYWRRFSKSVMKLKKALYSSLFWTEQLIEKLKKKGSENGSPNKSIEDCIRNKPKSIPGARINEIGKLLKIAIAVLANLEGESSEKDQLRKKLPVEDFNEFIKSQNKEADKAKIKEIKELTLIYGLLVIDIDLLKYWKSSFSEAGKHASFTLKVSNLTDLAKELNTSSRQERSFEDQIEYVVGSEGLKGLLQKLFPKKQVAIYHEITKPFKEPFWILHEEEIQIYKSDHIKELKNVYDKYSHFGHKIRPKVNCNALI